MAYLRIVLSKHAFFMLSSYHMSTICLSTPPQG